MVNHRCDLLRRWFDKGVEIHSLKASTFAWTDLLIAALVSRKWMRKRSQKSKLW